MDQEGRADPAARLTGGESAVDARCPWPGASRLKVTPSVNIMPANSIASPHRSVVSDGGAAAGSTSSINNGRHSRAIWLFGEVMTARDHPTPFKQFLPSCVQDSNQVPPLPQRETLNDECS